MRQTTAIRERGAVKYLTGSLLLGFAVVTSAGRAAEPIRLDQYNKLQSLIKPGSDEDRWANIPWLTDLSQARRLAAEHGKPILLWEMDGHPLGCT
jgi:hypothetical protein